MVCFKVSIWVLLPYQKDISRKKNLFSTGWYESFKTSIASTSLQCFFFFALMIFAWYQKSQT